MSRKSLLRIASIGLALVSLACAATAAAQVSQPWSQHILLVMGPSGTPAANQCLIVGDRGYAKVPSRHAWSPDYKLNGTCGLPSKDVLLANGQAVWSIRCNPGTNECIIENWRMRDGVMVVKCLQSSVQNRVVLKDGSCLYDIDGTPSATKDSFWLTTGMVLTTLRSMRDPSKCVIFNNRGHELVPTQYRWDNVPSDETWCGLGSQDNVYLTGQALFALVNVAKK